MSKRATKAPPIEVPAAAAAEVLKLSRAQFDRLVRAGVLSRKSPRVYDLRTVGPQYIQYVRDGKSESTTIAEAKLLLVQTQQRALEQRTRRQARQLEDMQEVRRVFSACMASIGGQLA